MSKNLEELPEGWVYSTLGDVCEPSQYGYTAKAGATGNYHFLRTTDITKPVLDWNNVPFCTLADEEAEKYLLKDGDIVISRAGSIGYSSLISNPKKSVFASYLIRFRPLIYKKYLNYFLSTPAYWEAISEGSSGIAVQNVNATTLSAIKLPVAPENEQIRIVEKLEELLSDLDNGVAELKAAQTKLTQYRQSLLKSAVEGTLTQEWREANAHKITETGEQFLARILKERRARWEQQKLEEFASKKQTPPKDWQKKYPEPVKPDTSDLPELPKGWVWASVDQLAWKKRYGSSSKTDDRSNGVPVLRMGNIQDGQIDYTNLKYLPVDHDEFPDLLLSDGDLLFNRTNSAELVGKTAIFRDIGTPCSYASYLISVTFCDSYQPDLAAYFINSVFGKAWLATVVNQTAGQANVNGTKLGELAMPVPPVKEQLEIINQMISEKGHVQSQLRNVELGIKQSEAQRKNILKDAFSGRLVEQNSDDEAASILLEKIEAERVFRAKQPKIKNPKKKASEKTNFMKTLLEVLQAKGDWMNAQDAFTACGVAVGTDVDRIEEVYAELRKLEKEERVLEVRRVGKYDQLKLKERAE